MEFGGAGFGLLIGIAAAVFVCWVSGPEFDCVKTGAWFVVIGMVGGLLIDWQWWRKDRWSERGTTPTLGDTRMSDYAYLLLAVGLGLAALAAVYLLQRRRVAAGESKHSWVSYLLLWPLIMDADQSKRDGRVLTGREWIGWGIVLLVAVLAIIFT